MTRGETIAEKRKSKGLTQEILSEKLGVSPQAVSRWETDQTCPDTSTKFSQDSPSSMMNSLKVEL